MPQIYNKELLDSYREPTKAHKTYQGVPNMSYAFTGRCFVCILRSLR